MPGAYRSQKMVGTQDFPEADGGSGFVAWGVRSITIEYTADHSQETFTELFMERLKELQTLSPDIFLLQACILCRGSPDSRAQDTQHGICIRSKQPGPGTALVECTSLIVLVGFQMRLISCFLRSQGAQSIGSKQVLGNNFEYALSMLFIKYWVT